MQQLVGGRPAQHERGRFRGVERGVDNGGADGLERPVLRVGPGHRHFGHTLSDGRRGHVRADLHDLADEIVAEDEGRLLLEVGVLAFAQQDIRELNACSEHLHQHLAGAGFRHRSLDHGEPVRPAEFT